MSWLARVLPILALACVAIALNVPDHFVPEGQIARLIFPMVEPVVTLPLLALLGLRRVWGVASFTFGALLLAVGASGLPGVGDSYGVEEGPAYWLLVAAVWLLAWHMVERLIHPSSSVRLRAVAPLIVPVIFGLTLLFLWEAITRGANVPAVLLPPPSAIGVRIATSVPTLWADFQQTFLKSVLVGYAIGCSAGFLVAIAIDRSPFLKRGLLPVGNFVSALPLVGIAPIMVMWFGFDWPSKAAVVVVMVFFPMLVNTVAGLNATGRIERDLMATYAATYWQTLLKLRLPMAAPFIFNALKITSTLALIGAIVAEFFGTPVVGMGFRISAAIGRLQVDMVWAEIAVAALAGSLFYGTLALIERAVTFWHPSMRSGRTG